MDGDYSKITLSLTEHRELEISHMTTFWLESRLSFSYLEPAPVGREVARLVCVCVCVWGGGGGGNGCLSDSVSQWKWCQVVRRVVAGKGRELLNWIITHSLSL